MQRIDAMSEPDWRSDVGHVREVAFVPLDATDAPIAVCSAEGRLLGVTPGARELLSELGIGVVFREPLPVALWLELMQAPQGQAVVFRGGREAIALGCTRYALDAGRWLLLMREVTGKHVALSKRLHQERLDGMAQLIAGIANDVRSPLASIVYNTDVLESERGALEEREIEGCLSEIRLASDRLRRTVSALLDFVHLGPPLVTDVALADVFARISSFMRPIFRQGRHVLRFSLEPRAAWVRGNPILIEQILSSLLANAVQQGRSVTVDVSVEVAPHPRDGTPRVRIRVADDGPGLPPEQRARIFEPFFVAKPGMASLGLCTAREGARYIGGNLELEETAQGSVFALMLLPGGEPIGRE